MAKAGNLYYVTRRDPATGEETPAAGRRRIFISYKKSDNRLAGVRDEIVKKILSLADVAVWYDKNLTAGADYNSEIASAISACDAVVLLLTKDILKSGYVWDIETAAAKEQKKAIIPVAYDLSMKDYAEVERRLGGAVQILNRRDGGEDDGDDTGGSFDAAFAQALDRFVINADLASRTERFFLSKTHETDISQLSGEQLFLMGFGYLRGVGTKADEAKGTDILVNGVVGSYGSDESARSLRAAAATELAKYYWVRRKPEKVLEYNTIAAENGSAEAMNFLGDMLYYGRGVPRNREEAAGWYAKAAKTGESAEAMYSLGKMFFYGRGVERDLKKAEEWYAKAADKGNADAMCRIAEICKTGKSAENDKTKAKGLFLKAADAGSVSAMYQLGKIYQSGTEKDEKAAFEWFTKAVNNGASLSALCALGKMYEEGRGTVKSIEKARELYAEAAGRNSKTGKEYLNALNTAEPPKKQEEAEPGAEDASAVQGLSEAEDNRSSSPARWLVPAAIILLIAAALCAVQFSGTFDIMGWLGSMLRA